MISVKADFDRLKRELDLSPQRIETTAARSLNKTATTLRTAARREIQEEIKPRKGGVSSLNKRITVRKASKGNLSAHIDLSEMGLGVENTRKATIRKVRNGGGAVRVSFRGKTLVKAFRFGSDAKVFMRKPGKPERVFSFTMVQEAEKLKVPETTERKAGPMFVAEFLRLVKVFRGL
ncbi:hypothetical protein [Roseibacillus ishigakijimensis]|uniref:Uncharacterized protein n=1 Tax=Roseibacillus ishigakijimensis TaxID=454146 RepID=A0A934RNG0_9BACT|nr:hypothetical protein [Roseibacillus ishigakijimensis]MBK1835027.1 hypothetical protein [Roseibacillus ishigakijimensis]